MPIYRGDGGSGDSSTDAYASQVAAYAQTASTKANQAADSASAASSSETAAALSEFNASTSETNAATSESNASVSETNANDSATAASNSASAAAISAASAATALDSFDDRYLGSKTSDPTVDNDGDPLITGALYYNSTTDVMRVYDGATWIDSGSGLTFDEIQGSLDGGTY
jgi:cobalamin biosynthesis Mg chelatase CobN